MKKIFIISIFISHLFAQNQLTEIYKCSYISTDRAVGLLKALGYQVVEFKITDGETIYDKIYTPIYPEELKFPYIIKMIDPTKTSLMDPAKLSEETAVSEESKSGMIPEIGGTYLHQMTSGEIQQQLMIVYEKNNPSQLVNLLSVLKEKIDLPARQIVIEALVIEINQKNLKDLGLDFYSAKGRFSSQFTTDQTGSVLPFSFSFNNIPIDGEGNLLDFKNIKEFDLALKMLIEKGTAEILSNPSVLVLDGRQARIQIGQQVPISKSIAVQGATTQSVSYMPVGIVLNLKPRLSDDGSEITMQVETIVSAVDKTNPSKQGAGQSVILAPTIDNRQVQTFIRVSNNTPFIIGGLISSEVSEKKFGIPFLMDIPYLGNLFQFSTNEKIKKEVIIVLTPHVAPKEEKNFSYAIPKDADIFDSFGNTLYRNAYRLRSNDIFDLKFITESPFIFSLKKKLLNDIKNNPNLQNNNVVQSMLNGNIPGEEIIVKRMIWEIVKKEKFYSFVNPEKIILFQSNEKKPNEFQLGFLSKFLLDKNATNLILSFYQIDKSERPFKQPTAQIFNSNDKKYSDNYIDELRKLNLKAESNSIIVNNNSIGNDKTLDVLRSVLVMKRILQLNSDLNLTIKNFYAGKQIIFPTIEDLEQRFHLIDGETAKLFYEVVDYYTAFENNFNNITSELQK